MKKILILALILVIYSNAFGLEQQSYVHLTLSTLSLELNKLKENQDNTNKLTERLKDCIQSLTTISQTVLTDHSLIINRLINAEHQITNLVNNFQDLTTKLQNAETNLEQSKAIAIEKNANLEQEIQDLQSQIQSLWSTLNGNNFLND
ncbi:MAG: hypothetical protein P4L22_01090 [Candidatus Babeliales bacterium]|nr:hypothetical protein [Candidatus Babeliales bacterium]